MGGAVTNRNSIAKTILLGGFIAGTIDLGAASLISWRSPFFICQAVASGLFGRESFAGGAQTALVGLLLQWFMSLIIAAVYVAASEWIPVLKRQWLSWGLAYGVGIFLVMNYLVVPLSAVGGFPHFTPRSFVLNLLAMLLFGVIVSYFARSTSNSSLS